MIINAIKSKKVLPKDDLFTILKTSLPKLTEKSIVVVTSKIVSLCEGSVVRNDGTVNKVDLIKFHAQKYIVDPRLSRYHVTITIKNDILIANSGIDESNGNGYFILHPNNSYESAKRIYLFLKKTYNVTLVGVLITDSRLTPLRWGTLGVGLSYCGFEPLKNYIGTPDIFGKRLRMTKASILDGLAASAVIVMGEGDEQTPLAVIRDIPFVQFTDRPPTQNEISSLRISPDDDIFAPLIDSEKWKNGNVQNR